MNDIPSQTTSANDDEISLLDLLHTIAENIKLLVVAPLVIGVLALGYSSFFITPTFTANTQFLPPQQQQGMAASVLAGLGGLAGAAAGLRSPADQYIAFLESRVIADRLIERFNLKAYYKAENMSQARTAIASSTRISSGKDGLIRIEVSHEDPATAAQLANAYVEELRELLSHLAVTEAQQRRVFFEKHLQQTQAALVKAEQALQATGVTAATLRTQPAATVEALARLQAQVAAQEVRVASMRGYLTENAPEFRQALTELSALRAQMRRLEGPAQQTLGNENNAASEYIARVREFRYQETLLDLFVRQYEAARVDESREGAIIQVLDLAVPPDHKSSPKRALIAIVATLASGFALLLFVFIRQAVRNASTDPASANKLAAIRRGLGFKPQ